MRGVLAVTLIFLLFAPILHAGEEMTQQEMERSIYLLRWAIAQLAIQMLDVLIEVKHSPEVGPRLRARAEDAIDGMYKILQVLNVRVKE